MKFTFRIPNNVEVRKEGRPPLPGSVLTERGGRRPGWAAWWRKSELIHLPVLAEPSPAPTSQGWASPRHKMQLYTYGGWKPEQKLPTGTHRRRAPSYRASSEAPSSRGSHSGPGSSPTPLSDGTSLPYSPTPCSELAPHKSFFPSSPQADISVDLPDPCFITNKPSLTLSLFTEDSAGGHVAPS